jgi:hypothetical protein
MFYLHSGITKLSLYKHCVTIKASSKLELLLYQLPFVCGLVCKSSCLVATLGVNTFIIVTNMAFVPLCHAAQVKLRGSKKPQAYTIDCYEFGQT